jgi:5-methylcytosine-specific restriction endonuclease McrA
MWIDMARVFAKSFYNSKEWKRVREYVFNRDHGLCKCGNAGEEVHHTTYLTPDNIGDASVALNPDLLVTLCKECHMREHDEHSGVVDGLMFDEHGDLIPMSPLKK